MTRSDHVATLVRTALAFADAKEAAKREWVETGVVSRSIGVSLDKATDNLLMAAEAYRSAHHDDGDRMTSTRSGLEESARDQQ